MPEKPLNIILSGQIDLIINGSVSRKGKILQERGPKFVIKTWVEAFNNADVDKLASLYTKEAVNHQVNQDPVKGRDAIREMFANEFNAAKMTCIIENLFEDGEWAILEWRDPNGLRGCGFFHVVDGKIKFQRGYWDKLSFLRLQGLPLPTV